MQIGRAGEADIADWLALRLALWPEDAAEARQAIEQSLSNTYGYAAFLAHDSGAVMGFAEASLRHDYVNGCETSPVAFLEGIYVLPDWRRRGVARGLTEAVADWARANGCTEFASDALLDNGVSHAFHAAIGFEETERVVYFRRPL